MTELRKLQLVQLKLLCEVDRICRKHEIKYFLVAGTLLGAVRHKGFIPWDDDVDISMQYDDYVKFCSVCEDELEKSKYFLQTMGNDAGYSYIFAKLRLENTLYIRKGQEHMRFHHGICIDIFPWYPVPEGEATNRIYQFIVARCKTIMWSPIGAISEKRLFYRSLYKMLACIPAKIPYSIINFMVRCCSGRVLIDIGEPFYGNAKVSKRRLSHFTENAEQVRQRLQVNELTELEFEGHLFYVPVNYDYYLKYMYGDYMQLPPKHERRGHHLAVVIDFGKH